MTDNEETFEVSVGEQDELPTDSTVRGLMKQYEQVEDEIDSFKEDPAYKRYLELNSRMHALEKSIRDQAKLGKMEVGDGRYRVRFYEQHRKDSTEWNLEAVHSTKWSELVIMETVDETKFDGLVKGGIVTDPDTYRTITYKDVECVVFGADKPEKPTAAKPPKDPITPAAIIRAKMGLK